MTKHHTWKQRSAGVLAAVLAFGGIMGISGCGIGGSDTEDSASGDHTEAVKEETAMGRYLEEDVNLPENCQQICDMRFLEDGTLRLCYFGQDYSVLYADSKDQGNTWSEGTDLSVLLGLDSGTYSISYPRLGKDGSLFCNVTNEKEQDPDNFQYAVHYYYIDPEGNSIELKEAAEITDSGYVSEAELTDRGTVLLNNTGNGIVEIDLSDGSLKREYEKGTYVNYFWADEKRLITVTDTLHYFDLETGEPLEDASALTEWMTADETNLQLISTSSYPVVYTEGDEEDSLFFADGEGLCRYSFQGSVVEQVIDGSLNSIGSPDTALISLARDENGSFYLAVYDGATGEGKILKYVYSADTPTVPDTELTVYSLRENDYLRQIAALFQKKYPDIYLNLETGMSDEDAVTSTDALKNLNTEILAGSGPDVVIMDGIPLETYIEKGMLADISDLLDKVEEEDGILENIRQAYLEEDGSQYVMPVKFAIPMLLADKEDLQTITDLETLADAVEKHQSEYNEKCLPLVLMTYGSEAFLRTLADVSAPAWILEDGTLDETAVEEYLRQAGRMYQAGKDGLDALMKKYEEYGISVGEMAYGELQYLTNMGGNATGLLSGSFKIATGRMESPEDLAYMYSTEQEDTSFGDALWNGQAQNCFIPVQTVGISARASQPEAAEKLVSFMLSQEGEKIGTSSGFPVNETVYDSEEYWAVGDSEGSLGTLGSGNADTGEYIELNIRRADEAKTEEIKALGKTLTTPSVSNEIILDAVAEAGSRYLEGGSSLEDAARDAIQQVNLYLSE